MILAMFVLDGKHKWWILTGWNNHHDVVGSYFDTLNGFLYKPLPLYNKFRAPSMILWFPKCYLPLLAVLGLRRSLDTTDKKTLLPEFKKA
jgi:hypothetical protein